MPAQVLLRWEQDQGVICIPKSNRKERQIENADLDFTLSEVDATALHGLDADNHFDWDPTDVP